MKAFFITLAICAVPFVLVRLFVDRVNRTQIKRHIPWFYYNIYLAIRKEPELFVKYRLGRRQGDYGELVDDAWQQEVAYYVNKILLPRIEQNNSQIDERFLYFWILPAEQFNKKEFPSSKWITTKFKFSDFVPDVKKTIEEPVFVYIYKRYPYAKAPLIPCRDGEEHLCIQIHIFCEYWFGRDVYAPFARKVKTPIEFEYWVAAELKKLGFNVRTTKTTGDQGADVLANKTGVSFAIQCKMYTKSVGNKAVQEANAARDFYNCDYGVVVASAGFTKSAKQAATACGVILLNTNQLEKLLNFTERR